MFNANPPLDGAYGFKPAAHIGPEPKDAPIRTVLAEARALPSRAREDPTWLVAAAVALSLHLAIALAALWTLTPEPTDDEIGAPAIELAMDMAAPKADDSEAPPGPESAASAAAPDSAEAKPQTEAAQMKQDTAEAENPELIASREAARKPEEKPVETRPAPSQASTASLAAEETSAPRQEATPQAAVARAPVVGSGRSAQRERAAWQRRLVAHLDRQKRYPAAAGRREAQVEIRFALDATGRVKSVDIARSSGMPAFDMAALDMMKRADPVPAPPDYMDEKSLEFTMPVIFKADRR